MPRGTFHTSNRLQTSSPSMRRYPGRRRTLLTACHPSIWEMPCVASTQSIPDRGKSTMCRVLPMCLSSRCEIRVTCELCSLTPGMPAGDRFCVISLSLLLDHAKMVMVPSNRTSKPSHASTNLPVIRASRMVAVSRDQNPRHWTRGTLFYTAIPSIDLSF